MPYDGRIGELVKISRIGAEELSVQWRIWDVLTLPCDYGRYDCYFSPFFIFGNKRWWLRLWLNWGRKTQNPPSGWLRLDLCRRDTDSPGTFHFSVGIRGTGGVEKSREGEREFSNNDFCYWDDFCSISELLEHRTRLMPDGILAIICVIKRPSYGRGNRVSRKRKFVESGEAIVFSRKLQDVDILQRSEQNVLTSEDSEATLKEQGVEELQRSLKNVLRSGDDCDVIINVQGKEFRAHRLILRARSPVFQAMFTHDMVERQSGIVTMNDCDEETFPHFLEHIYTGSVKIISTANVFSLYTASEKYDLPTLKRACAEFVKKNLSIASFCDAIMLAIKHDNKELMEHATEFFCNNTLDIIMTAEWQMFLAENPTVGNELHIKKLRK